ncbi:MAG: PAS domain S-box protein [Bacteroidales bacterium]
MSGDDHYKLLFDKMNEGFALHEIAVDARNRPVNYKFLEINRAFTKMTGITREQAIGRFVTEVLPGIEASTARWIETFGKVAQTGADVSFEEYFGELQKWYLVHAFSPGKNRFAVTFTDVTEKKLLENEVRVSEQKFRALVEQSLTGIYIFDRDRFLYVNSTFCDIFGYEEEEILNHLKPTDVVQDQEYGVARENIRRRLEGEVDSVHYVARGKRKDNKPLWIEIHGTHILLDRTDVITGTVLDITERFESERIIKESENTFRAAFEQSASGMCMTGLDGSLKEVNAPFCAMLGYERDELQGGHFNDITHPEDLEIGKDVIQRMISGEDPKVSFQKRYLKKSGETLWANIHSAVVTDATGKPSHFIVQIEDVTERKRVEMELKTSEELFSKAFNIGPTGLTITRISDGTFMDANASFLEMFGFEREEVLGKTSTALGMWTQEARQKIIDAQVQSGGLVSAELTARAKSGKKIHILFSSKPIDFRGEPVLITSLIDVSAAKQSLEALARSEERYRSLFENMNAGFVLFEAIPAADGKPADLRILAANKGFETTTGLNLTVVRGRCLTEVLPGIEKDEAGWIPTYSRIARMGSPWNLNRNLNCSTPTIRCRRFRQVPVNAR